jgi:hypothetical protein
MQKIFQPFLLAASLLLTSLPGARAQGAGSTASGRADETGKAPVSTTRTMEAYGRAYPYCREWSDNCQVCLSGDDGRIVCSTVAIACVQKPIECWSLPAKDPARRDAGSKASVDKK